MQKSNTNYSCIAIITSACVFFGDISNFELLSIANIMRRISGVCFYQGHLSAGRDPWSNNNMDYATQIRL